MVSWTWAPGDRADLPQKQPPSYALCLFSASQERRESPAGWLQWPSGYPSHSGLVFKITSLRQQEECVADRASCSGHSRERQGWAFRVGHFPHEGMLSQVSPLRGLGAGAEIISGLQLLVLPRAVPIQYSYLVRFKQGGCGSFRVSAHADNWPLPWRSPGVALMPT